LQLAFARNQLKPGLNIEMPATKTFTNDTDGLNRKLTDFYLQMDWIERMDVTIPKVNLVADPTTTTVDLVNDDFKRESFFLKQAQHASEQALAKLNKIGVPTTRPEDYFAEMVALLLFFFFSLVLN
jgi:rRNA-processing protein EBP2